MQLLECQEYLLDLEKSLENPSQSDRVRLLGGKDPSQEELLKKTEEVIAIVDKYTIFFLIYLTYSSLIYSVL